MTQDIFQKEYSIRQMLAASWQLFKEHFLQITIIILIVYIPINVLMSFFPIDFDAIIQQNNLRGLRTSIQVYQLLESFVGIIATMAIAYLIKNALEGKSVDYKTALKASLSRWLPAIGTNILLGIFLIGLLLLFIIPGLIYSVFWGFAIYAVILNNKAGKEALNYSKSIVKGRWWKTFWYFIVFTFLMFLMAFAAGGVLGFLPDRGVFVIISDTLIDVVFAFFTVVFTIFFINFDHTKIVAKEAPQLIFQIPAMRKVELGRRSKQNKHRRPDARLRYVFQFD